MYSVFDASPLLAERRRVLFTLLLTNIALTLVLGFIGFVSVRRMIRPMQLLENRMIDAASGKAKPISGDEFPRADQEAVRMYNAFNMFVRAEQHRQQLTKQLAEEEKLASLGRVASAMAHEINNPLGGLMNAVDTLRKHGDKVHVRSATLDLIQRGLQGIGDVVQAALATYRPERLSRPFSPRDFDDLKLLLGPELRRKNQVIRLDVEGLVGTEPSIPAGPVRQAILNLLLNAAAATPVGGTIRVVAAQLNRELIIEIRDQGSGIPSEAREILTGPESPGSPANSKGLGLWVVRQIADEIGATVAVGSSDGTGTRIELHIPLDVEQELTDAA
jgi:signal transduction histidine kinase